MERTVKLLVNREHDAPIMAVATVNIDRIKAVAALLIANGLFSAVDNMVGASFEPIPADHPEDGYVGLELATAIADDENGDDDEELYGINTLGLTIYADGDFVVTGYHKHSSETLESEMVSLSDLLVPGDPPAYLATFQGEAWIMDNAMPVDDARFTYTVTAREFMLSDVDLDGLAQAAEAPAEVKAWGGPFTVTLEPLPGADLSNADVHVIPVENLDDEHAANFSKPWLVQYPDGTILEFDDEAAACTHQGLHRQAMGLNEETGEPY